MITKLTLANFKSIGQQVYDFKHFDLLVGRNNSGKSTVLQALAIWQFCVDQFHQSTRRGSKGIQVVLPNFTALPLPEFNLLWKDKTDRHWPMRNGKKKQEYILIKIHVEWTKANGSTDSFGVELRYQSQQTIYAIPVGGWSRFRECDEKGILPVIAYVPPFSGLEPVEKSLDISPIRQQVGKGQPGSVLRNLLLRVCPPPERDEDGKTIKRPLPDAWKELQQVIKRWFSVTMREPEYDSSSDVHITVEYRQKRENYDVISGGSGFHQVLTLLAFLYGYHPTTILLDEPDAHLHVNLQRELLDYFKKKSVERNTQFLIATHAEELVRGVDVSQIYSLLRNKPKRIESTPVVLRAMAEVSNEEISRLMVSPYILYVEGESDERILRAWAAQCKGQDAMDKVCFKAMGGGGKQHMKDAADAHYAALRQILPEVSRLMLFDYDSSENTFHPKADNQALVEWKRKNIENYLLVPDAWKRAVTQQTNTDESDLFAQPMLNIIDKFFAEQNLTLPAGKTWKNLTANIFSVVDGKSILFEDSNSLFHQLRNGSPSLQIIREQVAMCMTADEIDNDVHRFLKKLLQMTNNGEK